MKRRRSTPVLAAWACAVYKQCPYRGCAAGAHRPVQRCDAAFVRGIRIGSCLDQTLDDGRLRRGIPGVRVRVAVDGVVKWFGAAAVSRADVRAFGEELLRNLQRIGCRSDVQGRIASVDVVFNLLEVVGGRDLAAGAYLRNLLGETGRCIEQTRRPLPFA